MMTLFDPPEEIMEKEVKTAEATADQLETTMGATAYTGHYGRAMRLVEETDHDVVELEELCEDVFRRSRFSRVYVDNEEHGYPYLTPTNFGALKPWYRQINRPEKGYISRTQHDLDKYSVEDGWIMVTCSGSVNMGSVFLATDFLSDYFLTHDMIRIVPKEDTLEGYLYAYLDSWVGRALMLYNRHGIGIDHIEPGQIEDLPIVLLPEDEREEIHQTVKKAYAAREEFLRKDKASVEGLGERLDEPLETDLDI